MTTRSPALATQNERPTTVWRFILMFARDLAWSRAGVEILRLDPNLWIKKYMAGLSYRDPAELDRFEMGLRKAGLPA